MERSKRGSGINVLIFFFGLFTIFLGALKAPSTYVYSYNLLVFSINVSQRTISFFTIFGGFFLVIVGYLLREKTRGSFRTFAAAATFSILLNLLSGLHYDYVTLTGVAFGLVVILFLVKRRKDYIVWPTAKWGSEIVVALITIIFTVTYGVTGSLLLGNEFSPHITSLGNALYFTGETVTTLGFGDILPVTLTAKMFTISISVLGIAIFFGSMSILIAPIIERRLGGVVNRMEKRQLESLRDYILVLGYSSFVHEYLNRMKSAGKSVIIIEKSETEANKLKAEGFTVLNQAADDEEVLSSFSLANSSHVFVASGDDGYNLLIVATLGQVAPRNAFSDKITVLVSNAGNVSKFRIFGYKVLDLPQVISKSLESES
ncbi:MAG: NAD-binding protein [Thermoplasmata archaeon]